MPKNVSGPSSRTGITPDLPGSGRKPPHRKKENPPRRRLAIRADVRRLVTFRPLNLNAAWPMSGKFDAIMCRNVAIYFDRTVQQRLWSRFADLVPAGGGLFIGHSERLSGPAAEQFEPCGITAYLKRA